MAAAKGATETVRPAAASGPITAPPDRGSVLKEHTVTLDQAAAPVRFRSYYNSGTLVHYELLPLARYMGFVDPPAVLDTLPSGWVRSAAQFDDGALFEANRIPPETLFGEQAALGVLCSRLGSRGETLSRILQDQCLRRIESDRVRLTDGRLAELRVLLGQQSARVEELRKHMLDALQKMYTQLAGMQSAIGKTMNDLRAEAGGRV